MPGRLGSRRPRKRNLAAATWCSKGRGHGPEGYVLKLGRRARITARTAAGVFYGGRTLVQLVARRADAPRGRARDRPRYRSAA